MLIDVTVACDDRQLDVAIDAPAGTTASAVLPTLARAVDADERAAAWSGAEALPADAPLGGPLLRTGAVLRFGRRARPPDGRAVLSLHVVAGPAAGLVVPLERGRLSIGRAPDNDVVLPDADVSRWHAAIELAPTSVRLHDLGSTNGTVVDGRVVRHGGRALRPGSVIGLGDCLLTVAGPVATPASLQPAADGTLLVRRAPRRRPLVEERTINFPTRPTRVRQRVQWLAALLPAAAGGALAWFAHMPQFLLFALLSPVMLLGSALGDRIHWRRSRRREAAQFRRQCADAARRVADGLAHETAARRTAAPDPAELLCQATLPGDRLWERTRGDRDALRVRVGVADRPAALQVREGAATRPAGMLSAVPIAADLREGAVGLAGPPGVIAALARWLVGQVAALHSPADVEVALLLDHPTDEAWKWARWLPHLRGRIASTPEEYNAMATHLTALVEGRLATLRATPGGWTGPWLVLVIDRASLLADVPALTELLTGGPAVGITAVCLDTDVAALPPCCHTVGQVRGVTGTRLQLRVAGREATATSGNEAVIDQVSTAWAETLARSIAPFRDAGRSDASEIPDDCPLIDMLGLQRDDADEVLRRWAAATGGARAVLGRTAEAPLTIDLAHDGPHLLVAGTTGSGKSELLQTLVATLAVAQPPDELSFLLIDYKGGAAFADCARLPHTTGLVTDLDPFLTERALRSLHSELRRRERMFAQAGVSGLPDYQAIPGNEPVARLVIVVDEFAALNEELPDFVRGLVGVAQRGRSLGIHLVLATQRPGNVVSPEIRANTSLRIALRVADPGESSDVLGTPLAAAIDGSCPGRGYLRAGDRLVCFQAGHASGTSEPDPDAVNVTPLGPWRRRAAQPRPEAANDLARLVDAIRTATARSGRPAARPPWLPPLPESLYRRQFRALGGAELPTPERAALPTPDGIEVPAPDGAATVPVALVDLPDEQRRDVLRVDLVAATSVLFVGTARSGRTGALLSLAAGAADQLAPHELHVHVVDATGALAVALRGLPHCGTVLGPAELSLLPRLLTALEREAARRLTEATVGAPERRAVRLLLIDGWDGACAALPDLDAAACTDTLSTLLRIGSSVGLTIAVAGDRGLLTPRFAGGFAERIVLRLADPHDYGLVGVPARDVPAQLPPGRGLRAGDGALVQVAHVGIAPDEIRTEIAQLTARWSARPVGQGDDAIRVRPLPSRIRAEELGRPAGRLLLGLAGDCLEPVSVDPFAGPARLLVAGPARSGRTTLLRLLARQAHDAGIAMLVAAAGRSPLAGEARKLAVPLVGPDGDAPPPPSRPTLLLVDDSEAFADTPAGDRLTSWLRSSAPIAAVAAGRADELATSYRGISAEVRRSRCGVLLRPGPVDGELLGVRLPRRPAAGPPGRGVAVGEPSWGPLFADGEPVPIQVAAP